MLKSKGMGARGTQFRKQGFERLLILIESSPPEEQKMLLSQLSSEDPGWAALIKKHMLTPQLILSWPASALKEVFPQLPLTIVVELYRSADLASRQRVWDAAPLEWRSKFPPAESPQSPDSAESRSAAVALVTKTRELLSQGLLDLGTLGKQYLIDRRLIA